jgi:hypothetical protein
MRLWGPVPLTNDAPANDALLPANGHPAAPAAGNSQLASGDTGREWWG